MTNHEKHIGKTAHFEASMNGPKKEIYIRKIISIEYYRGFIRYNCGDLVFWENQIKFVEI